MSEKIAEELKTTDGHPVKSNSPYMLIDGTQVYVDMCAKRSDGKTVYQVTPIYEGDAMHMECYGGDPVEVEMPYEHHGEPVLVEKIYKELPKKAIDSRYREAMYKVESAAIAAGILRKKEGELITSTNTLTVNLGNLSKELDKKTNELEPIKKELEGLQEQVDKARQRLSELEDESSSYVKKEEDAVLIDRKKLGKLRRDEFMLECLKGGGVDNWEWYDESLNNYWKRYPD